MDVSLEYVHPQQRQALSINKLQAQFMPQHVADAQRSRAQDPVWRSLFVYRSAAHLPLRQSVRFHWTVKMNTHHWYNPTRKSRITLGLALFFADTARPRPAYAFLLVTRRSRSR